jgi:hypothetical protein
MSHTIILQQISATIASLAKPDAGGGEGVQILTTSGG